MTQKEMLIKVSTDVEWIKTQLSEHLNHHRAVRLVMYGSIITAVFSLGLLVVQLVWQPFQSSHP